MVQSDNATEPYARPRPRLAEAARPLRGAPTVSELRSSKVLGWPTIYELAHSFL